MRMAREARKRQRDGLNVADKTSGGLVAVRWRCLTPVYRYCAYGRLQSRWRRRGAQTCAVAAQAVSPPVAGKIEAGELHRWSKQMGI
jgi:hypothetical protein